LKIDTFDLDLFSSRSYSETREMQVTREFKFLDLVDQKMSPGINRQETSQISAVQEAPKAGQWFRPVVFEGQPALALTDQFRAEMDKMRQLLDAVMDRFSNMNLIKNSPGGNFHLSRISQVNSHSFSGEFTQLSAYEYSETTRFSYSESEQTRFFADGIVNTMDGNEINFSFEMQMEHSFFREEAFSWTEKGYTLIDPLIVNAGITRPRLSEVGFSFDLDLDKNSEYIRAPAQGTGFLSLDKNRDGRINDGSELFGPATGNGFKELAAYDLDKNLWIDENDAVFDELTLYGLDENGVMHLTRIKDAGMGAIYLAGVNTAFDVKNMENELLAKVKKSSIALNEDGSIRSVQEVDWTA